jgi:hypothetical protein
MPDDNIIGIDGRQPVQLREDQAQREKREEVLRQKLKCLSLELQAGNAPGTYTIAHPHPPQPPYLNGWRDLTWGDLCQGLKPLSFGSLPLGTRFH